MFHNINDNYKFICIKQMVIIIYYINQGNYLLKMVYVFNNTTAVANCSPTLVETDLLRVI